jgi:hypothetical protein
MEPGKTLHPEDSPLAAKDRLRSTLSGDLIRLAITGETAVSAESALLIDTRGVRVSDATIERGVDLTAVAFARPIIFERCTFLGALVLLWERLFGYAFGILAGHGYKNYYALYWAVGVWLTGSAVFGVADRLGEMRPASEHVIVDESYQRTGHVPADYEPPKPRLFSADILLPIVDFSQKRFWLPRDAHERTSDSARAFPSQPSWVAQSLNWLFLGWFPKIYYYFEIAIGWVLASIAVAGFSGHLGRKGEE